MGNLPVSWFEFWLSLPFPIHCLRYIPTHLTLFMKSSRRSSQIRHHKHATVKKKITNEICKIRMQAIILFVLANTIIWSVVISIINAPSTRFLHKMLHQKYYFSTKPLFLLIQPEHKRRYTKFTRAKKKSIHWESFQNRVNFSITKAIKGESRESRDISVLRRKNCISPFSELLFQAVNNEKVRKLLDLTSR